MRDTLKKIGKLFVYILALNILALSLIPSGDGTSAFTDALSFNIIDIPTAGISIIVWGFFLYVVITVLLKFYSLFKPSEFLVIYNKISKQNDANFLFVLAVGEILFSFGLVQLIMTI